MNPSIVSLIVTTLLLLGTGYTAKAIFTTIERITLTRIQKGLSSSEALAQALTGKRIDKNGRLVPIDRISKSR